MCDNFLRSNGPTRCIVTRETIVSIMSSVSSILSTCVNFFDIFVHFSQDVTDADRDSCSEAEVDLELHSW